MGKNYFNLKFTRVCDPEKITFLDVTICTTSDGHLSIALYGKETAGNTILHATSFHPASPIRSIPYTQYLRIRKNCSDENMFLIEAKKLQGRLLQRGYSPTSLKKAFKKVRANPRLSLLFQDSKKSVDPVQSCVQTRIITTFNRQHKAFQHIVEKHWHILRIDPVLSQFIPNNPLITYKRARSSKDKLVTSEYTGAFWGDPCKRWGTFKCGGCPQCQFMNVDKNIIPPNSFCELLYLWSGVSVKVPMRVLLRGENKIGIA